MLFRSQLRRRRRLERGQEQGGIALLALVSAAVFAAYLHPDMVLSFTNAVMALCGFPPQPSP